MAEPWKAEMPTVWSREASHAPEFCQVYAVENLVNRANEELSKVRAERDEARERLSSLSSVLGFGMGDDSTSLLELVTRVEEGTNFHTDVCIKMQSRLTAERDAALKAFAAASATRIVESARLIGERAAALARVRELTEWRPMDPGAEFEGKKLALLFPGGGIGMQEWSANGWVGFDDWPYAVPLGWLHLPQLLKETE